MQKRIVLVIAYQNYQQTEYNIPKKILQDAGILVITASNKLGSALAKDNSNAVVDIELNSVKEQDYDGVFFIGGPGALEHLDNEISYQIIKNAYKNNKLFGAICISSRILAHAGVLANRKATGWNGDRQLESLYKKYSVTYLSNPVVVDEYIITAEGPAAAQEFGQAILAGLKRKEKSK